MLIQFLYTYFLILYYYSDKKVVVRLKSLPPRQAKTAKYLQPANSLPTYPCERERNSAGAHYNSPKKYESEASFIPRFSPPISNLLLLRLENFVPFVTHTQRLWARGGKRKSEAKAEEEEEEKEEEREAVAPCFRSNFT